MPTLNPSETPKTLKFRKNVRVTALTSHSKNRDFSKNRRTSSNALTLLWMQLWHLLKEPERGLGFLSQKRVILEWCALVDCNAGMVNSAPAAATLSLTTLVKHARVFYWPQMHSLIQQCSETAGATTSKRRTWRDAHRPSQCRSCAPAESAHKSLTWRVARAYHRHHATTRPFLTTTTMFPLQIRVNEKIYGRLHLNSDRRQPSSNHHSGCNMLGNYYI